MGSDRYTGANPFTGEKRIPLCCVIVGRSCRGTSMMAAYLRHYDSTTNESEIHLICSDRHVLPKYLNTYK